MKDTMFMSAAKLHITVAVMPLMDDEDRLAATEYLKECVEEIIM